MSTRDEGSGRQDGRAERSTSFGTVAKDYETFRPGPPIDAVRWLLPAAVETVVDLGAGTGALSRLLTDVALHVVAVEPDPDMRQLLMASVAGVVVLDGRGEAIPVDDDSVDAVVASSSWHWVDPVAGLREAARVLRSGGLMAALWTGPDPEGTFMRQAQAALARGGSDPVLQATMSGDFMPQALTLEIPDGFPFGPPEHQRFAWTLPLTADQLIGLLGTLSWVIVMEDDDRRRLLDTARRLLRDTLGVEGDVTVDVDFVCDAYRARRSPPGPARGGSADAAPDVVESLILDLLEWIGPSGRPYDETLDAWKTSCPRLPVWEAALERGFIDREHDPSRGTRVSVSAGGVEHVRAATQHRHTE